MVVSLSTATHRTSLCPFAASRPVHKLRCPSSTLDPKSSTARSTVVNAAEAVAAPEAPTGASALRKYETLIVLKPTLTDEERDKELARFESFLIAVRSLALFTEWMEAYRKSQ
jgi:small subunit ribosomal protein S6